MRGNLWICLVCLRVQKCRHHAVLHIQEKNITAASLRPFHKCKSLAVRSKRPGDLYYILTRCEPLHG
ncbi:UBP-type zinc finger domain-containing protein [Acidobacteriota bacterium]